MFQYTALPFGLATVPRVFTKMHGCGGGIAHRTALFFLTWLIMDNSQELLDDQVYL